VKPYLSLTYLNLSLNSEGYGHTTPSTGLIEFDVFSQTAKEASQGEHICIERND